MYDPAAVTDVSDPRPRVIKSRIAGALLALITLALFGLANLPYQYVESEVEWIGYLEVSDGGSYRTYQRFPIMAGWPLRYWIRYADGEQIQDRLWLPARLAVNVGLGMLLAAGVYLFVQFRRRKLVQSSGSPRVRFDLGLRCGACHFGGPRDRVSVAVSDHASPSPPREGSRASWQ